MNSIIIRIEYIVGRTLVIFLCVNILTQDRWVQLSHTLFRFFFLVFLRRIVRAKDSLNSVLSELVYGNVQGCVLSWDRFQKKLLI